MRGRIVALALLGVCAVLGAAGGCAGPVATTGGTSSLRERALTLARAGDLESGRRLVAEAIRLDPTDASAYATFGVLSYWLGDDARAERALNASVALVKRTACPIEPVGRVAVEEWRCLRRRTAVREVAERYLEALAKHRAGTTAAIDRAGAALLADASMN